MNNLTIDERYDRHNYLPGWNQEKLARSTVIIIGMGALGNAVAQALALAGVGRLVLCDMDRIERSNLSRAPLFRESDLGEYKVDAAAGVLHDLAPDVQIDVRSERFEHGVGLAEVRDADLTLSCLDSRAARLELAGRCGLVCAPWIDGATGQWDGEVRPYLNPEGPCYGCGMDDHSRAESTVPQSCQIKSDTTPAGATAPLSLLVGADMALTAVRYLMGLKTPQQIKVLQAVSGAVHLIHQARDPGCPYHHILPPPTRLPLSNKATVRVLLDHLEPGACPLVWTPFSVAVRCRACGFQEKRISLSRSTRCQHCAAPLQQRTSLEINRAPGTTVLDELGIAPREILPVKFSDRIDYIELS
ncbi:MAG: ThiF family adenylyltransferase [Planctomycetes bacterium]|nr:ThiF family adenylyltransferase [Planctomycetota bacterium]